jgi:hypothetical protein
MTRIGSKGEFLMSAGLTLSQKKIVSDLSDILYDFLPASGNDKFSFPIAAQNADLYKFWSNDFSNKREMIRSLLTLTFLSEPENFSRLICEIVSLSIDRGRISDNEIQNLDKCLMRLGVRISELSELIDGELSEEKVRYKTAVCKQTMESLKHKLLALEELEAKQRGLAFEKFLVDLFHHSDLAPRGSFKLIGEQIDGSFILDGTTYLVEAKWQQLKIGNLDLQGFAGKVSTKAQWTRGFYISYSGYSADGFIAFQKSPTALICMSGEELHYILKHALNFVEVLRRKVRHASETGEAFIDIRTIDINLKTDSFGVSTTRHT